MAETNISGISLQVWYYYCGKFYNLNKYSIFWLFSYFTILNLVILGTLYFNLDMVVFCAALAYPDQQIARNGGQNKELSI